LAQIAKGLAAFAKLFIVLLAILPVQINRTTKDLRGSTTNV